MVTNGFTITRAVQSASWPVSSANLEYAAVWGSLSAVGPSVPRIADRFPTDKITTFLEPAGRVDGDPFRLAENVGIAFQGCNVLGKGFIIKNPEDAEAWIESGPEERRSALSIS